MMAKFVLQDNVQPVFRKKQKMPLASLEQINEEPALTLYVKKKFKEIRVCADFSTGLNTALKDFNHPLLAQRNYLRS